MQTWTITDVGVSRQNSPNEDSLLLETMTDGSLLAAVCDGMGGANAGEVASSMAAEAFRTVYSSKFSRWDQKDARRRLASAVDEANRRVFDAALEQPKLKGMGTTVVAAAIRDDGKAVICNVGDSRAYHLTEYGISQITSDHSLVNEMLLRGEITKGEAHRHPSRNLITRAIGVDPEVQCDTYYCTIRKGEYILLCSDGLHDQVSEPEIYYEVFESGHPEEACANLVQVANNRGGRDNISIILIAV